MEKTWPSHIIPSIPGLKSGGAKHLIRLPSRRMTPRQPAKHNSLEQTESYTDLVIAAQNSKHSFPREVSSPPLGSKRNEHT